MKKIKYIFISAVFASLVSGMLVVSAPKQTPNMCPTKPYPVSNIFSRSLQGLFLMNFGSAKIAESEIKSQLAKTMQGDIDIDIKTYSAMDLVAGKFKSAKLKANNVNLDGIHISNFEAKTLCDFNYINYKQNPVIPKAPALIEFNGIITEDDFTKTLASPQYSENLTKIKAKINNLDMNLVDFLNPKINIVNGKIHLSAQVHFAGLPSYLNIPVKIGTGLKADNGKIKLTNLKVLPNQGFNMPKIASFVESINPVIVDLNNVGIQGSKVSIKNLDINDGKINVGGTIWIPAK